MRNIMLGDPESNAMHEIAMRHRRNPRRFDLTAMRQDVKPVRCPVSDSERVERLRVEPLVQFEDLAVARKLPRGVVP